MMLKTNAIIFAALFALSMSRNGQETMKKNKHLPDTPVFDGPYVLYRSDSVFVNYIEGDSASASLRTDALKLTGKDNIALRINTDLPGKTFTVKLKPKLANEKAEYKKVGKMLILSDIEGNFEAFRKLLQANHVIDDDFNWTFEKNHLVLIGDFVDRGTMVTEVLWLIYSLEEKAKAAGGYVHYILGNHEIMNMSNDLRYVQPRYLRNAALMNTSYMKLFGPDAEIGRWLATKNVTERVGDILFMHGGISQYINMMNIPLKELNDLVRPFYTDTTYEYKDNRLNILYSDIGPFWYRGYYTAPKATMAQIDSTLSIYDVRYLTTGHTIVASEIKSFYDGKLFDTDVHHAGGHSEALLYEDGKFVRVNAQGTRLEINPM
ncbi:MAG TPA: metallophosphoesterase [Chitinophagaceae bacterium]|nr:metallophosphoesterase [Chitinophagaceae bacterium]